MREFLREHSWAVTVSVLLHGLLVGGVIIAAFIPAFRKTPTLQPLPIDAVVVDSQFVHAGQQRAADAAASAQAAEQSKAAAADAKAADAKAAEEAKAAEDAKAAGDAKA